MLQGLSTGVTGLLVAGAAVLPILLGLRLGRRAARPAALHRRIEPMLFLFSGDALVDATPPARDLLSRLRGSDLPALLDWLEPRLPGARAARQAALRDGTAAIAGAEGAHSARLRLTVEDLGEGTLRLTLVDPCAEDAGIVVDSLSQAALEGEAALLREAVDRAPMLAWRQRPDGTLTWANAAYLALCEARNEDGGLWPLPRLFPIDGADPLADAEARPTRLPLAHDGRTLWFDCHAGAAEGGETIVFALPADDAVEAERNLREFVQTLTKTFAGLPIGLAIFDRDRNLQLFNPALIDLTNLPTGFLSARPSLHAFLDRLREARMIPEPRDYRSWRRQMSTLEAGAAAGYHVETWSLPGGQTYRVTGRPHADGGIAFLLEDITSEITLTRRFRAQLSLGTQVIDALEDAVAVYGSDGAMQLGNDAWRRLWGDRPLPLAEAALRWGEAAGGGAGAARLSDSVAAGAARSPTAGAIIGPEGVPLGWRLTPLQGGQLMVSFSANPVGAGVPPVQPAAKPVPAVPVPRSLERGAAAS